MKIDFSHVKKASFVDSTSISGQNEERATKTTAKERSSSGYKLDISGTVMDNAAFGTYDSQGKTSKECMQEIVKENGGIMGGIGTMDVSLQRNYLAVMSNSLSAEDYKRLSENGFSVGNMSPEDMVTVVDEIKVKLAEAGVTVEGYNDSLDSDVLENIGNGNVALIESRIENALRANDLPTTDKNIKSVMDAINISEEISKEGLSDSAIRYIIDNDLDPTIENIYLSSHKAKEFPVTVLTEEEMSQLSTQMNKIIEEAGMEVNEESVADASWIISHQLPLTAKTLRDYHELRSIKYPLDEKELLSNICDAISSGKKGTDALIIHKERVVAESRLALTTEANRRLIASDFSIDTKELERQVDELKSLEKSLYSEVNSRIDEIKALPATTIGHFVDIKEYNLNDVYEHGTSLKVAYDKANYTYEALSTEVRSDLGDSIKKAFANSDELLDDMGMEKSESNYRAIRILGYNKMDITEENIEQVKEVDNKVNELIDKLKPATVLKLIREKINPLSMNVDELSEKLDSMKDDFLSDEKYSKFLWKLEQSNQINESEKEAFIGVYRLIHQLEKADGAAIGSIMNQGADVSLKNLLTAIRSHKSSGMDYKVDDDFGGLVQLTNEEVKSISAQIEQAFGDEQRQQELEHQYNEEMSSEIRDSLDCEEAVIQKLIENDIPLSADNLFAMSRLQNGRGDIFKQLWDLGKQKNTAKLIERLDSKEDATDAIQDLVDESEQLVKDAMASHEISYQSFKDLMVARKQISLIGNLVKNEEYNLPMDIDGSMASINLKIIHDTTRSGVDISIYSEKLGAISVAVDVSEAGTNGVMMADTDEGVSHLVERRDAILEEISSIENVVPNAFSVVRKSPVNALEVGAGRNSETDSIEKKAKIDSAKLYQLSKRILMVIGKGGTVNEN